MSAERQAGVDHCSRLQELLLHAALAPFRGSWRTPRGQRLSLLFLAATRATSARRHCRMGSDNPPPPAGRLKARKKAQVIRALVVIAAVALLVYLTQDPVDPHKGVPHATGTAPGSGKPPFPKAAAKGASIDAGGEFKIPIRTFTRHDSSRHRENDQMTLGIRPPVKRDRVGEERPREIPKSPPLTPKQTFHGLYDLSAVDIKVRVWMALNPDRSELCHLSPPDRRTIPNLAGPALCARLASLPRLVRRIRRSPCATPLQRLPAPAGPICAGKPPESSPPPGCPHCCCCLCPPQGVPQLLQQFGGSVVLVVNVASACGYTEANCAYRSATGSAAVLPSCRSVLWHSCAVRAE